MSIAAANPEMNRRKTLSTLVPWLREAYDNAAVVGHHDYHATSLGPEKSKAGHSWYIPRVCSLHILSLGQMHASKSCITQASIVKLERPQME